MRLLEPAAPGRVPPVATPKLKTPRDLMPLEVHSEARLRPASPAGAAEVAIFVERLAAGAASCSVVGSFNEGGAALIMPWSAAEDLTVSGVAYQGATPNKMVMRFQGTPRLVGRKVDTQTELKTDTAIPAFFSTAKVNFHAFGYYNRLKRVHVFVQQHLGEKLLSRSLAEIAGMEASYFSEFFHLKVGVTFKDWLQQVRLARALETIARSNESITVVALEVGFPSIRSLQLACQKYLHMTPAEYKKLVRPC